jgi:hypothetical protein
MEVNEVLTTGPYGLNETPHNHEFEPLDRPGLCICPKKNSNAPAP